MKKLTKILMSALCITAICGSMAALGGCDSKKESITVSGSSSVTPIMEKLAAEYEKTHDVRITVIVHEKTKINGHYRQTVEIVYNFVGTNEPQFFDDDETYN